MLAGLATFVSGLFSSSKAQDTAIDAVRKLGGLDDMNAKDKAQFILDYMSVTKHQSPVRRLIAVVLTALYSLVVTLWLLFSTIGYLWDYEAARSLSEAVRVFLEEVITQPFNLVMSFYFVMNIVQKLGNK